MPQAKMGVIGGSGLYDIEVLTDIEKVNKMKNGSLKTPVISPWPLSDGEAAYTVIISHKIYSTQTPLETFSKPAQCTDKLEKVTSNQSFKTFLI